MPLRRELLLLAAAGLAAGAASAAAWQPVPGAPEVAVDLASMQLQRQRVRLWVRWRGRPPLLPEAASQAVRKPRVYRTAVLTEFDCGARTWRSLAAEAHDSAGVPVFMSSVPSPVLPVQGEELSWTYDAVCEAARAGG